MSAWRFEKTAITYPNFSETSSENTGEKTLSTLKINRVVGGKNAGKGEFPHQVSLQVRIPHYPWSYQHMCGGSIINEQWIITAGHCIFGLPSNTKIIVKAGKTNIKEEEKTEQVADIMETFVHKDFTG